MSFARRSEDRNVKSSFPGALYAKTHEAAVYLTGGPRSARENFSDLVYRRDCSGRCSDRCGDCVSNHEVLGMESESESEIDDRGLGGSGQATETSTEASDAF